MFSITISRKNFSNIEEPLLPDNREQFLNSLAYSQFTLEEIRSGYAYKTIMDTDNYLEQPLSKKFQQRIASQLI